MTSPRRLKIFIAGAVATVVLVAVGPGEFALGATPGADGKDSPRSPRGDNARGVDGRKGNVGQRGEDGQVVPRGQGRGRLGNVDVDVDTDLPASVQKAVNQANKAISKARRQVRNAGR